MRAKFSDINYTSATAAGSCGCSSKKECGEAPVWMTPEHIAVKGSYSADDLLGIRIGEQEAVLNETKSEVEKLIESE